MNDSFNSRNYNSFNFKRVRDFISKYEHINNQIHKEDTNFNEKSFVSIEFITTKL